MSILEVCNKGFFEDYQMRNQDEFNRIIREGISNIISTDRFSINEKNINDDYLHSCYVNFLLKQGNGSKFEITETSIVFYNNTPLNIKYITLSRDEDGRYVLMAFSDKEMNFNEEVITLSASDGYQLDGRETKELKSYLKTQNNHVKVVSIFPYDEYGLEDVNSYCVSIEAR
jgi:hypothetical protein